MGSHPYRSSTQAFVHQQKALAKLLQNRVGALLMEPGTGKTKIAIDYCGEFHLREGLSRVLVVAPLTVLSHWEDEVDTHLDPHIERRVFVVMGSRKKKNKLMIEAATPGPGLTFLCINPEAVWREEFYKQVVDNFDPQCVIVDESHLIKNVTARRSKAITQLRNRPYRLILTGTPITKSPLDVFGQWRFLKPVEFGSSYWQFSHKYAVFGGFQNREVVGYRNLDELKEKVEKLAYICSLDECFDLPEVTQDVYRVKLHRSSRVVYRQMEKEFFTAIFPFDKRRESFTVMAPNVVTKMLKLSQITGGFIIDHESVARQVGSEKLFAAKELISIYTYPDRKMVVFCRFLWEVEQITRICRELGLVPLVLTGDVPPGQRGPLVRTFHNNPKRKIFISQISAGGLGIDLSCAQTLLFYSLDYDYSHYVQACGRVHRKGQQHKCHILHLQAEDTIDEAIIEAVRTKQDLAECVVKYIRRRRS